MATNLLDREFGGLFHGTVHSMVERDILIKTLAVYLLYHFGSIVYSVYFGPLSKFPGPKLWAASSLPYIFMLWNGQEPTKKRALHERYGPVVRISPNELSYCNSQAWKDIYGHRTTASKRSFPKSPKFYDGFTLNGSQSILTADDSGHARQRKILSHSFSMKALKEQETLFEKWVQLLVSKLKEHSEKGQAIDLVAWYNYTTFDVMADLTFGESLHMLEGSSYSPWVATIFSSLKSISRIRAIKLLPGMTATIELLMPPSLRKKRVENFKYATDRVDKRLERDLDRPDIWDQVLKRGAQEGKMSLGEMHSNASVFMIAGTETTATWLSGITYHLLRNPPVLSKLVSEIRTAFSSPDEMTTDKLQQLPYLNACLEEGLRMYPPVPTGMPRMTPKGGAMICGSWVPEDVTVSVSHWTTYRSAANFNLPNEFIPERWTGEDERFKSDDHSAFQPFSAGPRNCIGRNLAYSEARNVLSHVLWYFDLSLDPRSELWADQLIYTVWQKDPLWVDLKPVRT